MNCRNNGLYVTSLSETQCGCIITHHTKHSSVRYCCIYTGTSINL